MVEDGRIRLDKWLWQARFFKTRGLSAEQITAGHVRVNGAKTRKIAHSVRPGDVITFVQAKQLRIVSVLACGTRRGPASEAQALYRDEDGENTVPPE
ncbi:MAG: RNA-binding S4 domain-containing protein [Albidovulum sp.]